ncbi:MAG: hypothetical protein AVDCRST_MAG56-696 [uncultured Cytophagales bacterium]|uniref:Uncharacterized protein n=1 Tax=uncultured Cytophagales bacterium TaxID=158755 RepID=A0A6J4HLH7_9SPHI|nr:MAG: hypothetical protein AVDCRST_MAG56-696 [uncultured Cytophagales bacterium]
MVKGDSAFGNRLPVVYDQPPGMTTWKQMRDAERNTDF